MKNSITMKILLPVFLFLSLISFSQKKEQIKSLTFTIDSCYSVITSQKATLLPTTDLLKAEKISN